MVVVTIALVAERWCYSSRICDDSNSCSCHESRSIRGGSDVGVGCGSVSDFDGCDGGG